VGLSEGSLEIKLPTIWTNGQAELGKVREEKRRSKKIREEKESKKEEAGSLGKSRVIVPNDLSLRSVEK
jgi:hypothetical protein